MVINKAALPGAGGAGDYLETVWASERAARVDGSGEEAEKNWRASLMR